MSGMTRSAGRWFDRTHLGREVQVWALEGAVTVRGAVLVVHLMRVRVNVRLEHVPVLAVA